MADSKPYFRDRKSNPCFHKADETCFYLFLTSIEHGSHDQNDESEKNLTGQSKFPLDGNDARYVCIVNEQVTI
jgi:hypothetical protein